MRSLTLLRHAKSSWDDTSLDDFYRPLSDRGRRSARAMGKYLADTGAAFDLILASPAERVAKTLKAIGKGGWHAGPVQFEQAIYHAGGRDLLLMVRAVPAGVQRLLLVGHNPALQLLALQLCREDGSDQRAALAAKYPTGALAEIELDIGGWNEADAGCGRLAAFVTPRSLDVL